MITATALGGADPVCERLCHNNTKRSSSISLCRATWTNRLPNCRNIVLKNIDDLHSIVDGTREKRLRDLPKVREMIMNEMVDFLTWYYTLPLMPPMKKRVLNRTGSRRSRY